MSASYEDFSLTDFRKYLEMPSVIAQLGSLEGKVVFDFGCGTGVYSRLLKQLGAKEVHAFDISEGMLEEAKKQEAKSPLGIHFYSSLPEHLLESCDVVLSVYVMPYAFTVAELDAMSQSMASLLKPSGKLVTLPIHPKTDNRKSYYAHYGFSFWRDSDPYVDGCLYNLLLADNPHLIQAVYWSEAALVKSLEGAGFQQIEQKPPIVSKEGLEQKGEDFWQNYLEKPHAVILTAYKNA